MRRMEERGESEWCSGTGGREPEDGQANKEDLIQSNRKGKKLLMPEIMSAQEDGTIADGEEGKGLTWRLGLRWLLG